LVSKKEIMKKLTLLLLALFICSASLLNAQTNDGKVLLGITSYALGMPVPSTADLMSLGFGNTKYKSDSGDEDGDKTTNFNLQPKVGYFINEDLAAGLEFMIVSATDKGPDEGDGKNIESVFLVGPFLRYYFPVGNLHPFAEVECGLGSYKDKLNGSDYDYEDKYNLFIIGGGIGLAAPVGNKAAFDITMGYNSTTAKYSEDNEDNSRMVTGCFGIKIGLIFLLGGAGE
jgi:hypothetical protein